MFKEKNILLTVLSIFVAPALANMPPMHTFQFDNRSDSAVYVWVTAATDVKVPSVTQLPSQVLTINPNSTGKIYFEYTNTWDGDTLLALKFCNVNSTTCLNTVGEFSMLSITPNLTTTEDWRVKEVWSGMVYPHIVTDNIFEQGRVTWNRDSNFPQTIVFQGKKNQNQF